MKRFGRTKKIHFIGVGGIGMSGLAELLLNLGYEVSGSDLKESSATRRTGKLGGQIYAGHHKNNIRGADVVVYSSAIPADNPEIVEAREGHIPVIPRAEMLAELMRLKYGISIAGAHGKTTTTSMVASILSSGGLDPTVVIGGRLDIWGGSNAKLGQGDILLAESDESDGSFMALSPTIAVVTNIDLEHVDHYGDMDNIRNTFVGFINKIPFYGTAILCLDNEEIQNIIPRLQKKYITYGLSSQADIQAREIEYGQMEVSFEALARNRSLGRMTVGLPGNHNVLNALAGVAVGLELELKPPQIKKGLKNLGGLARRFQIKGEQEGLTVIDDYGHHPTEISTTLETAKRCWPERRLVVIFQPHRFTRTRALLDRFFICFNQADVLIITPIYPAGEDPIPGVTSESLAQGIKDHGHREVYAVENNKDTMAVLSKIRKKGDILMTLGAGDIYRIGDEILGLT